MLKNVETIRRESLTKLEEMLGKEGSRFNSIEKRR
jgi:hypothetical protein